MEDLRKLKKNFKKRQVVRATKSLLINHRFLKNKLTSLAQQKNDDRAAILAGRQA